MSAKYVFVTGGVVSSLGKGLAAASIGCLLESRGLRVNMMKFDPYLNVDPGNHVAVPARRSLRHRRRCGDRPRPGALRALYPRAPVARQQPDHRPHLRADHPQGAARRLPGQNSPGHSPRDQRDQERHAQGVGQRGGRHHRRDRRHGGRYRIAAVSRGHPPDAPGTGPRKYGLCPPDAGAVDLGRAGAEDQAHPALGEGTAFDRHSGRHSACAAPTGP